MDLLQWWYGETNRVDQEQHLFPDRAGRNFVHALRGAMGRAKINYKGRYHDVYALRHTYNTDMRGLIEDEKLRAFTGHRTPSMSENYDHKDDFEDEEYYIHQKLK